MITSHICRLVFNILSIIIHSIGIHLLRIVKRKRRSTSRNESTIVPVLNYSLLILLSLSEIAWCICYSVAAVWQIVYVSKQHIVFHIVLYFLWASEAMVIASLFAITSNRLISVVFPLWYRSVMSKKRFNVVVGLLCLIVVGMRVGGLSLSSGLIILKPSHTLWSIGFSMQCFIRLFYLVFCVFTYFKIFRSIVQSRQTSHRADSSPAATISLWKTIREQRFLVPLFITFTYLVFVLLPFTVRLPCILGKWNNCAQLAFQIQMVTIIINNISDALIYILIDKDIQNHLKQYFRRNHLANGNNDVNNIQLRVISSVSHSSTAG